MANSTCSNLIEKNSQLALDILVSAAFIFVLCFFFEPQWETNDDVAMSMVAHGYGIAAVGMPNLIFSNVLWGYLVRAIPQIDGVLGYSIATIGVLFIVGAVVLHAFRKLGVGWLASLLVLIFLFARPVLFPQFTINAGLLTVGAVVCWHVYAHQRSRLMLLAGCILAFGGYLVRSHEFLLVLLVALPLLPWLKWTKDRTAQASSLALLLAIGTAAFIDSQAYKGENWKAFNSLNPARAPITDFGADAHLKSRPDILDRHGYSENDIDLINSWFFVDSEIANPVALNAMLTELGPLPASSIALNNGWIGIKTFTHPVLLPGFFAALLLLLLFPNRKLFFTWALCLAVFFALGVSGRPSILRVYIPVISLLIVAPLLVPGTGNREYGNLRKRFALGVLVVAALFNTTAVFSESRAAQIVSDQKRMSLQGFPEEIVVVWGATFPFEAAYPVLKQSDSAMAYKIYGMGVFTLAPFSTAYGQEISGNGMLNRLASKNGIPILAKKHHFAFLDVYCKERLSGVLHTLGIKEYGALSVRVIRCESVLDQ
ncbi:hypothetical protein [Candidatus Phycosocius spiralis]|nr:hypothetical protein [Candidatus Phycosocius spiralis]